MRFRAPRPGYLPGKINASRACSGASKLPAEILPEGARLARQRKPASRTRRANISGPRLAKPHFLRRPAGRPFIGGFQIIGAL